MKRRRVLAACAGVIVCIIPISACADEPAPPLQEVEGSAGKREPPRLFFDNIVGLRVRPSNPSFGDPILTGGPVTFRVHDGPGLPLRSLSIGTEVDGRVGKMLTLGGGLGFSTSWLRTIGSRPGESLERTQYWISLEPRVGLFVPLTDGLYLWPRIGPTLSLANVGGGHFGAMVDTSLVVALHKNVFLALGPRLEYRRGGSGYSSVEADDELQLSFSSRVGLSF